MAYFSISRIQTLSLLSLTLLALAACSSNPAEPDCTANRTAACAPVNAIEDEVIQDLYSRRRWATQHELTSLGLDPVRAASEADIPVQEAFAKIVGPSDDDAHKSLAAKIWMIENARHSIDVMYYIFRTDLAGRAVLAALCDAVIRGVDVRLMVDSLGSATTAKSGLTWLKTCEENAGWIVNQQGQVTNSRARMQIAIFNAVSSMSASPNRRSHDKLLIVDGEFPGRSYIMTGGRNIALDYYGFSADGELDPSAYRDSEILLRGDPTDEDVNLGELTSGYYSLLFLFRGNRLLGKTADDRNQQVRYNELARSYDAYETLKAMPLMLPHFTAMDRWMKDGFKPVKTRLAHDMANLDNRRVVRNVKQNIDNNPNSIMFVLKQISDRNDGTEQSRIVSPYLFLARYKDDEGVVIVDEAQAIRDWLIKHPNATFEVVTNSVLTSDNFSAQAIIDFDTAPRLLLTPELREAWLNLQHDQEALSELVNSDAWKTAVNNPRLALYETGRLDSAYFPGGDVTYGKLHAKFWQEEDLGFVGTSNFDYRSRLYNNEMGYFFQSEAITADLIEDFEFLKRTSYRWGSPEWLEMRQQVMQLKGMKGWTTRRQRTVYKTLSKTGLQWLF